MDLAENESPGNRTQTSTPLGCIAKDPAASSRRSMQRVNGQILLSPSDLNNYVECTHLTTLALEVARDERPRPHLPDEEAELLRRKGAAHEHAHLERLRADGRAVVEIDLGEPWDFEAAARRTREAMR